MKINLYKPWLRYQVSIAAEMGYKRIRDSPGLFISNTKTMEEFLWHHRQCKEINQDILSWRAREI